LRRLADCLAEQTGSRVADETVRLPLKAAGSVRSRPQHRITSPHPEDALKSRRSKPRATVSEPVTPSPTQTEVTPELAAAPKAMRRLTDQQVMIPTPGQPKRYGIGVVEGHTGQTVGLIHRPTRRRELPNALTR